MPSSCGPTCIQMIFFRHGIRVEQEQLSYDLGLVIEERTKPYYTLPFQVVPTGDPKHGLKLDRFEQDQIIDVLGWFRFKPTVVYYSHLGNIERLVMENLSKGIDIMINFQRAGISHNNITGGHLALVSSYDSDKRSITVCDPTTRAPNYREVDIDELKEAMSEKRDKRERGIVIIEKITKDK